MRRARRATTVVFFLHAAVYTTWVPRIPEVKDSLGLDNDSLTLVFTGVAVGPLLTIPPTGHACRRFGSRPVVRVALAVYGVSLALPALAPGLAELFCAMVLLSAANSTLAVAMNTHGVTVQAQLDRPVFASLHAANSFGGLAGSGLGTLAAAAEVAPKAHLGVAAALSTLTGVVVTRGLLPASADDRRHPAGIGGRARARVPASVVGLGLLALCVFLTESAVTNWSTVYFTDELDAPAAVASVAFTVFAAAMGAGRLVADRLAERFGAVRTVRWGALTATAGIGLAVVLENTAAAIVGLGILGAGIAATVPAAMRAAGENPDVPRAVGIATVSMIGYLGFLAGPSAFGLLAGVVGLSVAFGLLGALAATAAALAGSVSGPNSRKGFHETGGSTRTRRPGPAPRHRS
ncbi:MFS transporter [Streptomyces cupreus]|uniref:MFS transporter n=1 Tax=Streptomyces cupreus TaxID=2759956 RepID=A0A7X1IZL0_9ACTN|nr:MFS transporter [Streptomyces cupreus]MBC2900815.1 MFS transporter [Streptomyces cupreus]